METVTLAEIATKLGQIKTAKQLGLTQGAVSRMVIAGREVYVSVDPAGSVRDAYEIKKIGKFRADS